MTVCGTLCKIRRSLEKESRARLRQLSETVLLRFNAIARYAARSASGGGKAHGQGDDGDGTSGFGAYTPSSIAKLPSLPWDFPGGRGYSATAGAVVETHLYGGTRMEARPPSLSHEAA